MRVLSTLTGLLLLADAAAGQAPASSDLWRVATASLTSPAALQTGPTATFWNPAAADDNGRLSAGIQFLQTSDVIGLSGVIGALTHALGPSAGIGVAVGRMSVGDLVRTTTSPNSEAGEIPVYAQFAGAMVRITPGPVRLGGSIRFHDSRFDADRTGGTTVDLGVRVAIAGRLVVAASSHFFPLDLNPDHSTDYYAGIEYEVLHDVRLGTTPGRLIVRYGTAVRDGGQVEHGLAAGIAFGEQFRLDGGLAREAGYAGHPWRPSIGIALGIGRYHLTIARANGVNDVGATYRMGLDAGLLR